MKPLSRDMIRYPKNDKTNLNEKKKLCMRIENDIYCLDSNMGPTVIVSVNGECSESE